jgi:hypothetical protein
MRRLAPFALATVLAFLLMMPGRTQPILPVPQTPPPQGIPAPDTSPKPEPELGNPSADPALVPLAPAAPPAPAVPLGCRPLTDKAMALDLSVATAQAQKRDLSEQLKFLDEAIALWTKAVEQCEDRAKERAKRNLADDLKQQERLSEQQGAGPKCESAHRDASALQELARKALSERRFSEASVLFRKSEDAWENASELCTGSQQDVAQRRREQSEIDGHNAEFCAPAFEKAREYSQRLRTTAMALSREEKQDLSLVTETLWREALPLCKGAVQDVARTQIQTLARERGTPWVALRPVESAPSAATPPKTPLTSNLQSSLPLAAMVKPATTPAGTRQSEANVTPRGPSEASGARTATAAAPQPAVAEPIASRDSSAAPTQPPIKEFVAGAARFVGRFVPDPHGGTLSGSGKVTWDNGDTYEGTVEAGKRHGKGVFAWANGQTYEGDWEHDTPVGLAKIRFASGNQYEGHVANGLPQGAGQMRYASGDTYAGNFVAGVPHGKGIYHWKNGQRFEGDWVEERAQGQGKLRFANGNVYEGPVVNGVPQGQGRSVFATGETYTGQHVNGLPDGTGTFNWPNGDQYSGQWKAGRKHGQGVFTWKGGQRWEGLYDNDQPIEPPTVAK